MGTAAPVDAWTRAIGGGLHVARVLPGCVSEMLRNVVREYRRLVCVPREHAHGQSVPEMIRCALAYLDENG